ncbi:uncharacterized protein [Solanum lycopersicum]|uniref:uncharacterized protein n=1 Tax=Solanum lycopersicum TaxID=4081 RepID=UPI00374931B8
MSALNVKIDKFTGRNSFSLWQIKMRTLLKQQLFWVPLSKDKNVVVTLEMEILEEKVHSTIMLFSAAVAEEDTNSKEDISLVADEHTHHSDVWVLDSGASYHICPRREWFTTYEQVDGGSISMANSSVCKVVGTGSIKIRTHDGSFCTLNEVRHIPLMTKNLISLSLLDSKGFTWSGKDGVLQVWKVSNLILNGVMRGIARHRTVRNTPKQNGVAELMNQTLLERVEFYVIQNESDLKEPEEKDQEPQAETDIPKSMPSDIHRKVDTSEPSTYKEAILSPDSEKWSAAMGYEMESLYKNQTWDLVIQPSGRKITTCKWVFKKKEGISPAEGVKYKARKKYDIQKLKGLLSAEFEMKDLGASRKILGMDIIRDRERRKLFLSQRIYIQKVLARFGMSSSKPIDTPSAANINITAMFAPQSEEENDRFHRESFNTVWTFSTAEAVNCPAEQF